MQASPGEYAPLYHNIGVALGLLGEYLQASDYFLRAYETNKKEKSLQCYLAALHLSGNEQAWQEAVSTLRLLPDRLVSIEDQYKECKKRCSIAVKVRQIKKMRFPASNGKLPEYYDRIDEMIRDWKEEYRQQISI